MSTRMLLVTFLLLGTGSGAELCPQGECGRQGGDNSSQLEDESNFLQTRMKVTKENMAGSKDNYTENFAGTVLSIETLSAERKARLAALKANCTLLGDRVKAMRMKKAAIKKARMTVAKGNISRKDARTMVLKGNMTSADGQQLMVVNSERALLNSRSKSGLFGRRRRRWIKAITKTVSDVGNFVEDSFNSATSVVTETYNSVKSATSGVVADAVQVVGKWVAATWDNMKNAVAALAAAAVEFATDVWNALTSFLDCISFKELMIRLMFGQGPGVDAESSDIDLSLTDLTFRATIVPTLGNGGATYTSSKVPGEFSAEGSEISWSYEEEPYEGITMSASASLVFEPSMTMFVDAMAGRVEIQIAGNVVLSASVSVDAEKSYEYNKVKAFPNVPKTFTGCVPVFCITLMMQGLAEFDARVELAGSVSASVTASYSVSADISLHIPTGDTDATVSAGTLEHQETVEYASSFKGTISLKAGPVFTILPAPGAPITIEPFVRAELNAYAQANSGETPCGKAAINVYADPGVNALGIPEGLEIDSSVLEEELINVVVNMPIAMHTEVLSMISDCFFPGGTALMEDALDTAISAMADAIAFAIPDFEISFGDPVSLFRYDVCFTLYTITLPSGAECGEWDVTCGGGGGAGSGIGDGSESAGASFEEGVGGCPSMHSGYDYPHNDVLSTNNIASASACSSYCFENEAPYFAFGTGSDQGKCWCKSALQNSRSNSKRTCGASCHNGVVFEGCPAIEDGWNYPKNDASSATGFANAQECSRHCFEQDVTYFSFAKSGSNQGKCWCKRKLENRGSDSRMQSGASCEDGNMRLSFYQLGDHVDCTPSSSWLYIVAHSAADCAYACKRSEPNAKRFVWVPYGDKNCKCASETCTLSSWNIVAAYEYGEVHPGYGYIGCFQGNSVSRVPDVAPTAIGVQQCRDACFGGGFHYFGFECPHGDEVHCECGIGAKAQSGTPLDKQQCMEFNTASGSHCSGPFVVYSDYGQFAMGAGAYGTLYKTSPEFQLNKEMGCFQSPSKHRIGDVIISPNGVKQCRDECLSIGYSYFGFECPHSSSLVHCQCTSSSSPGTEVDSKHCKEFNPNSGSHCTGPFLVVTDFGEYAMGAGAMSSFYTASPNINFIQLRDNVDCGPAIGTWLGNQESAEACAARCKAAYPWAERFVWVKRGDGNCKCVSNTCHIDHMGGSGFVLFEYEAEALHFFDYPSCQPGCLESGSQMDGQIYKAELPTPVTDGLVLDLRGDRGISGSTWQNQVSGGPDATIHNGVNYDYIEKAFKFPGGEAEVITVPLQTNPAAMLAVSYSAWVKPLNMMGSYGWVLGQVPDYGWSRAVTINDGRLGGTGLANKAATQSGFGPLPLNQWSHVVGVFEQPAYDQYGPCSLYLDGRKFSTSCRNGFGSDSNEYLAIGGRRGSAKFNAQMLMTDISVYSKALTDGEVSALYNAGVRISQAAGQCYLSKGTCEGCLDDPERYKDFLLPEKCTGYFEYPSCKPNCLRDGTHQIEDEIYKIEGKCYLAITDCMGCLEKPESYPEGLMAITCSGAFGYPACAPGCLEDNHQIEGEIYKVASQCYVAMSNCDGCLQDVHNGQDADLNHLRPIGCTGVFEYDTCRPDCLDSNSRQLDGQIYKVNGLCYLAKDNCNGCLSNPTAYPNSLAPIAC